MTLSELKNIIDDYADKGYGNCDISVILDQPAIGCRASTTIQRIYPGFDWENGRICIETVHPIQTSEYAEKHNQAAKPCTQVNSEAIQGEKSRTKSENQACSVEGLRQYIGEPIYVVFDDKVDKLVAVGVAIYKAHICVVTPFRNFIFNEDAFLTEIEAIDALAARRQKTV